MAAGGPASPGSPTLGRVRDLADRARPGPDAPRGGVARRSRPSRSCSRWPAIGVRGLNLGVEFTGGRLVEYSPPSRRCPSTTPARRWPTPGCPRAVVQTSRATANVIGARRRARATTSEADVRAGARRAAAARSRKDAGRADRPEPRRRAARQGADRARRRAGRAAAYLAVRFRWTFGAAAVLAMVHDVLILVGRVRLARQADRRRVPRRAADRHRLLGQRLRGGLRPDPRAAGAIARRRRRSPRWPTRRSCRPFPRTVNTGLGAVFILAALLVLGGDSLTDFALALLIGIVVGTYSSVFTAAPLGGDVRRRSRTSRSRRPRRPAAEPSADRPPPRHRRRAADEGEAGSDRRASARCRVTGAG